MNKSINMGKRRVLVLLAMAVAMVVAALPSVASADFGVKPGSFQSNILDSSGAVVPSPQAGDHPYAQQIKFAFNTKTANIPASPDGYYQGSGSDPDPDGDARNVITNLPPGFIGNPQAAPRCEQRDFPPLQFGGYSRCATSAQVGIASIDIGLSTGQAFPAGLYKAPLYNLVPPKGVVARFGFVLVVPIVIDITVRTGSDYGITATVKNASEVVNIYSTSVTLWGVPADPSHDAERFRPGQFAPGDASGQPLPAGLPLTPFLTNPAQCDTALTTGLSVDSWQNPGTFLSYASAPVLYQGCDRLTLKSSLDVTPTSAGAGEPTGIAVDLNVDQPNAPNALGSPPLKKAVVTLPEGVTISPSSADGLGACSADQIGLHNDAEPTCPDSSKVGSVQIDTPLLDEPLLGSVYLAKPGAGNNPFNSLVALYIVAKASGVLVKLPGEVTLDPKTGRAVSTFDNTPQVPFTRLHVAFKGGPRAPLSQAVTCGPKTTSATLTSWAGQVVNVAGSYNVGPGSGSPSCGPQGFVPQLTAGSLSSAAGASSPFSFRLTRSDADQQLSSVSTLLPEGLLANVKDVTLCQAAQAAAGTCGPESQIGHVTAGSGPGPSPFYINNGRAYLTTGYNGAPFGLSIVVRAIAGPFDLGDVVVRGSLTINPVTSRVTVATDPFPTILQGIPLQMRDVRLNVDRPNWMLNPTSCAAQTIDATVVSTAGTKYSTSVPYRATDCEALALKPKLALSLTGKGQTTDNKHPGLVAHLTQTANESRLSKVAVTLPLALALDPDNAQALCKPEQALAKACPATSIVGQAKAVSVLHEPLQGPVYFVEGIRIDPKSGRKIKTLPKLFIPLKGEGVEVDLNASSEVDPLDHLVTTFDDIPDAPVSSVDLTIAGGQHGILVVSGTDVCKGTQTAQARMDGQSGKIADSKVLMVTPCLPSVISSKVTSKALTVKLGGLGAGKVTVSGSGLRKTSRTLTTSSVATVVAKRTKGSAPTKITVRYDPAGPAKATTNTLSLKKAGAAKKSSARR
jgi:hypothetical protein